jgi:hypothetical protein
MGRRPTKDDKGALFVGRAPWPAADAHVGLAEDTRNRPTASVFNGVASPYFFAPQKSNGGDTRRQERITNGPGRPDERCRMGSEAEFS